MSEVLLVISVICNLNTPGITMPKEEKIVCVEQLANCLIGPGGKYLKDMRSVCESRYKNFKKNNGNGGGKND